MNNYKRRNFLKAALTAAVLPMLPSFATSSESQPRLRLKHGSKILFQGDSITDGGRSRNNDWNHVMGHGYAYLVASELGYKYPEKDYHFFNRGISGNKVPDLLERWDKDTIQLNPDVLSILIGINDTSADMGNKAGFTTDDYKQALTKLLTQTRDALPDTKLVIGEPFVLPVGKVKNDLKSWTEKVSERQYISRELSQTFEAIFIPYQKHFNEALKKAPAEYWIWDGIHPMPAGHQLMAREWIKAVLR
jgi:lysophospholipase L1-like esterase